MQRGVLFSLRVSAFFCLMAGYPVHAHAALAPLGAPLALHDCRLEHPLHLSSAAARCGSLFVAEDREDPRSRRIRLFVAVIPAQRSVKGASPLFLLAGGPGQAASDLYVSYTGAFARIARTRDLVLLDQRGTGRSARMDCDFPDDWSIESNSAEHIRASTRACLNRLGERVRFYTTSAAVQDLDAARRALGFGQIALYGASYGTRVAQLYARRFPAQVEAIILDGVIDPERAIGPNTPQDAQRALDSIVARCGRDADCRKAFPHLAEELARLRSRFAGDASEPVKLPDPESGEPRSIDMNRLLLAAALRFLSYSAVEASLLPALLHAADSGDAAPLAAQAIMTARQVSGQIALGMQNSVVCSEDWPFYAAARIDRAALVRTYQGTEQLDGIDDICALWPRGPVDADLHAPWISTIPVLLLSGELDPVTPPQDAQRAAKGLRRHRHLVLHGEGHGQLATGCVPRLMAQFLTAPDPAALDAHCLDSHAPAPFFLSPSGPAP